MIEYVESNVSIIARFLMTYLFQMINNTSAYSVEVRLRQG